MTENTTKSVCLSVGHADGKYTSTQCKGSEARNALVERQVNSINSMVDSSDGEVRNWPSCGESRRRGERGVRTGKWREEDVPALVEVSASSDEDESSLGDGDDGCEGGDHRKREIPQKECDKAIMANAESGEVVPALLEITLSSEEEGSASDDDDGWEFSEDEVRESRGGEEEQGERSEVTVEDISAEEFYAHDESKVLGTQVEKEYEQQENMAKGTMPEESGKSHAKKRVIRVPTASERRKASASNQVHAYGVQNAEGAIVVLRRDVARAKAAKGGRYQLFDEYANLARNIRAAKRWVARREVGRCGTGSSSRVTM